MSDASDCQWFYEKDGEEAGPVAESELLKLLKSGEIYPDTLLWTESMVNWQPSMELEPFRTALRQGQSVWIPAPRPWIRFWARRIDLAIYEAIALGWLARLGETQSSWETTLTMFLVLAMILAEALQLTYLGTTPGKWLLNISLTTPQGSRLGFGVGLYRTFLVWLRGLALGIPLINVVAMAIGMRNLTMNGETSWDRDALTIVRHRRVSHLRWVGAFLILFAYVVGLTVMFWPQVEQQIQEMQKQEMELREKA